jgi:hypothetical protein
MTLFLAITFIAMLVVFGVDVRQKRRQGQTSRREK